MDVWRGGNDNHGTRRREIRKEKSGTAPGMLYFRLLRLPPQLSARTTAEETKGVNLVFLPFFPPFSPMCYGAKSKRHCIYNATI